MMETTKRRDGLPVGIALGIALGILALIGAMILVGRMAPARPAGPDTLTGQVMCEKFVTDRLRAPSTAKFAWGSDKVVTANADGSVTLRSFVDAQNGFGAQIRTRFTCTVREVPERQTWQLVSLDMP